MAAYLRPSDRQDWRIPPDLFAPLHFEFHSEIGPDVRPADPAHPYYSNPRKENLR